MFLAVREHHVCSRPNGHYIEVSRIQNKTYGLKGDISTVQLVLTTESRMKGFKAVQSDVETLYKVLSINNRE